MTDPHRVTDAEMAAIWAAQALTEGRYALGRALANLAVEAARVEATQLPAPLTPDPRYDLAEEAQRSLFGQPAETQVVAAATGRCTAEVVNGSYREPCHGVAYWQVGNIGDAERPAVVAGWYHMDPALDQDHQAVVGFTPAH